MRLVIAAALVFVASVQSAQALTLRDVIELASGEYNNFTGGNKPSAVTIRPAAGAKPEMSIDFSNASNIVIACSSNFPTFFTSAPSTSLIVT